MLRASAGNLRSRASVRFFRSRGEICTTDARSAQTVDLDISVVKVGSDLELSSIEVPGRAWPVESPLEHGRHTRLSPDLEFRCRSACLRASWSPKRR